MPLQDNLGPCCQMAEPEADRRDVDEGQKALGGLVVTGGDGEAASRHRSKADAERRTSAC